MTRLFVSGMLVIYFFVVRVDAADSSETGISPKSRTTPQRIVSINLCTDELLMRLVPPERVVALTKHSANSEISTVAVSAKPIKKIQGNVEEVVACKADLLVGGRFSNKETLRFFQYTDVPVLVLDVPKNFDAIYDNIRKLARAVDEDEKGEAIIQDMQEELAELKREGDRYLFSRRNQSSSETAVSEKKTHIHFNAIFFQSGNLVPGAETFENAIMEAAGLENVAVTLGIQDYGNLPLEKLIQAKPDILILASDQTQNKTVRGEVLMHPAIQKALPNIKTVTIPSSLLNCGSPASVEAVRILVKETQ